MFHEYKKEITELKQSDAHFVNIFNKHNDLDDKINEVENGRMHMDHFEVEKLKKEKLKLKDDIQIMLLKHKKK